MNVSHEGETILVGHSLCHAGDIKLLRLQTAMQQGDALVPEADRVFNRPSQGRATVLFVVYGQKEVA